MKKVIIILSIITLVILSGCIKMAPGQLAKANKEIKEFLDEYPNAELTMVYLESDSVAVDPDFTERCQGAKVKDYYKVIIEDPDSGLQAIAWTDDKKVVCVFKEGYISPNTHTTSTTIETQFFCGDDICQSDESCNSCSQDCGNCKKSTGGGGFISLTTYITTDVLTSEEGEIQVTLRNSGNKAAYNLQISIISNYFSSTPVLVGTLGINKPLMTNVSLDTNVDLKEGNYPVVLLTEYTDDNGYPFSSVSPITLTYKNPYPSRISGVFENIEVNGKRSENLVLKLKNMDQVNHDVNIRLILPNEISSDVSQKNIKLDPKDEKEIVFKVSNFAGLEGSSYTILATIEYEDNYHYSSITLGTIKIN